MEPTLIDFNKVVIRVLELIIVKPFTLPFRIYKNTLIALSQSGESGTEEELLIQEFPLYIWYIRLFDAWICLSYPLGAALALYNAFDSYMGFTAFLGILILTYFIPLLLGLVKEISSITLKIILYLKIMAKK